MPVNNADSFVDDILGHTPTWKEHIQMLRELFAHIRDAGLTARPTKCFVGYEALNFVGHTIGRDNVRMDPHKLEKIRDAPRPITKRQLRAFLGLAGYYSNFVPNYTDVVVPLTDLTKKREPNVIRWGEAQERAFNRLKVLLSQEPILRMPDFGRPFILQTDASETGVGAVLLQSHEDGKFPVTCVSKKLLPRERNYSTIERECLAIVFAIKRLYAYLYGREFVIQTDHQPLAYIQKCKTDNSRIMRWALFLQNFKFKIEAIKGSENVGADYLSRLD